MKRLFGVLLIAAFPLSLTPTAMAHTPAVVRAKVKISNFAFTPQTLNIAKGTKVIWVNTTTTTSHTSTSDTGKWDSGIIAPGAKFARVFKRDGTFTYHCNIHPTMMATVVVTG